MNQLIWPLDLPAASRMTRNEDILLFKSFYHGIDRIRVWNNLNILNWIDNAN